MYTYIHQKNHIFDLYWHIHGFLLGERNFPDILFYKREEDILFPKTVYHDQHNHQERDSLHLEGNYRTQTTSTNRYIVREYLLKFNEKGQ